MKRLIIRTLGMALTGALILITALRGVYLLNYSGKQAVDRGHRFLLAASKELDDFAADHGNRFPTEMRALSVVHRDRDRLGVENLWNGVVRAPLFEMRGAFKHARAGELLDPWGRPWRYRTVAGEHTASITSLGADGRPGGEGNDADLSLTKRDGETALSTLGHEPLW